MTPVEYEGVVAVRHKINYDFAEGGVLFQLVHGLAFRGPDWWDDINHFLVK